MNKKKDVSFLNFFKKLGPGLITGASDDDPSGIATYSQAGAQFGTSTLWTALITFPLMLSIQEMCARIGMVTSQGLSAIIKEHYSKSLLFFITFLTIPAILLNIVADIASMGAVAHLVVPMIPAWAFSILMMILLLIAMISLSYKKIVKGLKYLCLSLLMYLVIPFLYKQPWLSILKSTFIPKISFNKEYISILVAILGTTISPYMFFWQATLAAENKKINRKQINRKQLNQMLGDVSLGMFASNLVMYFIILTAGVILFKNGITHIETVEEAAKALEPLAGKFAYFFFALGILGTGALAIPVLVGTLSYILSTVFNLKMGLNKLFHQAQGFYVIIIVSMLLALLINFMGISPVRALIWTAILYGLTGPVMIFLILRIANNKKIMRSFTNGRLSNCLGWIVFTLMSLSAVAFLYFLFF